MGINEVKIAIAAIKAAPDNQKAIDTLEKILKNILTHPLEAKYRKLKVAGKVFTETLLPVDGALDFLYSLGFAESDDGSWLEIAALTSESKTMLVRAVFLLKTNQSSNSESAPLRGNICFNPSPIPRPITVHKRAFLAIISTFLIDDISIHFSILSKIRVKKRYQKAKVWRKSKFSIIHSNLLPIYRKDPSKNKI